MTKTPQNGILYKDCIEYLLEYNRNNPFNKADTWKLTDKSLVITLQDGKRKIVLLKDMQS